MRKRGRVLILPILPALLILMLVAWALGVWRTPKPATIPIEKTSAGEPTK